MAKFIKTSTKILFSLITLPSILGVPFFAVRTSAQTTTNQDVPALLQRLDELEQEVKILQRNREVDQETAQTAAADKAKTTPTVTLGDNGLIVRSANSNFLMNIHGFAQLDYRAYLDSKTAYDTFLLRRVRPIIEGTVYNKFDYKVMFDLASGVTANGTNNDGFINDAYLNARLWPDLQIQGGKFKTPLGLERLQTTANLPFVETGFPTQFTPNYEVGVIVHNGLFDRVLNYAVGIFNGAADGGSEDIESQDEGKEFVGRLFAQPFLKTDIDPLRGLGIGVAGTTGYRFGTTRGYTTPGQQTFFSYAAGANYNGNQHRLDPQAYYYWGPFGVLGEYVISSQSIRNAAGTTERFDNRSWQVIGSWYLTGEQNSFSPVTPLHSFGPAGGGWGALELVGRIGQISMDNAIFNAPSFATATSAHGATSWGAGINWHVNRNIILMVDYEQTSFKDGVVAPGSVTGQNEHVILSRCEFKF